MATVARLEVSALSARAALSCEASTTRSVVPPASAAASANCTPPRLEVVAAGSDYGAAALIVPSPATERFAPTLTPPNAVLVATVGGKPVGLLAMSVQSGVTSLTNR